VRLFVAVELPDAVAAAAMRVSDVCRTRARQLAPAARMTWVPRDRLHLTVRFIGDVPEGDVPAIEASLAAGWTEPAFSLGLSEAGTFPGRGAPRVLWLAVGPGKEELRRLEREVTDRLGAFGIPPEPRRYTPHLTLARVRDAGGLQAAEWVDELAAPTETTGTVDAITLFASQLSPKGPTYTALQRVSLGPT